jgi:hypothetical protein
MTNDSIHVDPGARELRRCHARATASARPPLESACQECRGAGQRPSWPCAECSPRYARINVCSPSLSRRAVGSGLVWKKTRCGDGNSRVRRRAPGHQHTRDPGPRPPGPAAGRGEEARPVCRPRDRPQPVRDGRPSGTSSPHGAGVVRTGEGRPRSRKFGSRRGGAGPSPSKGEKGASPPRSESGGRRSGTRRSGPGP